MKAKTKEALEQQARELQQHVLDQTAELKDAHRCKVLEETIFMLQHHVNAIKPTL